MTTASQAYNLTEDIRRSVFSNSRQRCAILALQGDAAVNKMEELHEWTIRHGQYHPLRRSAINLIVELATRTRQCFPSMTYPTREQPISELILTSGGGFADVFRGVSDGMLVGVKRSRLGPDTRSTEEVQNAFRKEAILWHHLDHPRLLPFLGVDEEVLHTSGRIDLVMPWMAGGTLRDFIRCEDYSPARDRLRLLRDVAQGLHHLHSHKLVHGDLTDRNVLIDEERHAVLSDFGLTVLGHTTQGRIVTSFHVNGTAGWMSPERVQLWVEETNTERRIKPSADVYAFGCLCYAICSGRGPFEGKEHAIISIHEKRQRPVKPLAGRFGDAPDDVFWNLICRCWRHDAERRPHISNVLAYFGQWASGPLSAGAICVAMAIKPYKRQTNEPSDRVELKVGDDVEVYDANGEWWAVRKRSGEYGYTPRECLRNPAIVKATALRSRHGIKNALDLTYSVGDKFDVLAPDLKQWMAVNAQLRCGNVCPDDLQVDWPTNLDPDRTQDARALYNFDGSSYAHSASFRRGERITVVPRNSDWLLALRQGHTKIRLVPASHLELLHDK